MERGEGRFRQKELESATIDPNRDAFLIPGVTVPEESGAKRGLRYAGRALVAVFALIGVLTVVVGSVNAIREPMLQYLVKHFGEYSSVTFPESENIVPDADGIGMEVDPLAGLLPEGYFLYECNNYGDLGGEAVYKNTTTGLVIYRVQPDDGFADIDTENAEKISTFSINNYDILCIQAGHFQIIWRDNSTRRVHDLSSNSLDCTQLLEIATNLINTN